MPHVPRRLAARMPEAIGVALFALAGSLATLPLPAGAQTCTAAARGITSFSCPGTPTGDICGVAPNFTCYQAASEPTCTGGQVFNCNTCACACPSGQILCGSTCQAPAPNNCSPGQTVDQCTGACTGYAYALVGTPLLSVPQSGYMNIGADFHLGGDVYFGTTKALRVDGSTPTTLNIGNWGGPVGDDAVTANVIGTVAAKQFCIGASCITAWPSGGGSTPTLQQVTDAGNATTKGIAITAAIGAGLTASGATHGVVGSAASASSYGVYGDNSAGTGVYGHTSSVNGYGVYAVSDANPGVGESAFALMAGQLDPDGQTYGTVGYVNSPNGYAVVGWNTAGGIGVYSAGQLYSSGDITTDGELFVNGAQNSTFGGPLRIGNTLTIDPPGESGLMYYNIASNKFRCFENGAWKDCVSSGAVEADTLQTVTVRGATTDRGISVSPSTGVAVSAATTEANFRAHAVKGVATWGTGVYGETSAAASFGVRGQNNSSTGVGLAGTVGSGVPGAPAGVGVWGYGGTGVQGTTAAADYTDAGVKGIATGSGTAVYAESSTGYGVYARSLSGNYAIYGGASGFGTGVLGYSANGTGLYGYSAGSGRGVLAYSAGYFGIEAQSNGSGYYGVWGRGNAVAGGVSGTSAGATPAVYAYNSSGNALEASSFGATAVSATGKSYGVYAVATNAPPASGWGVYAQNATGAGAALEAVNTISSVGYAIVGSLPNSTTGIVADFYGGQTGIRIRPPSGSNYIGIDITSGEYVRGISILNNKAGGVGIYANTNNAAGGSAIQAVAPTVANSYAILSTGNVFLAGPAKVGINRDPATATYALEVSGDAGKTVGGSTWQVISDERVKEDVRPFTDGLAVIGKIRPVSYVFNGLGGTTAGVRGIGVIAQDLEEVAPYMVRTVRGKLSPDDAKETDIYNLNSDPFFYLLVNAVKEQQAEIEGLKARIEELEAR